MAKPKTLPPILIGGLIAGVLDISYAFIFSYLRSGRTPAFVLQSVASGALGRTAYQGGTKTALLGLAFHFLIATIAAAVFVLASRAVPMLLSHWIVSGSVFGICVYAAMNCIVLRLSAIKATTWPWSYPKSVLIGGLLIHVFGIGLPIALAARKYSK
jgi:uncharacterized membrane protein YagU involved in acid resistance